MPKGSYPSINRNDIDNFEILVSIDNQEDILQRLNDLEENINRASNELAQIPARKQAILDKYLK